MRNILLAVCLFGILFARENEASCAEIQHVEPLFWWTGMKNPDLQILVHGPNIAENEVSLKYAGVTLKDVVKTTNPNYLFLNVSIAPNTKPGEMKITFSGKEGKTVQKYELRARSNKPGAQGFTT